MCRTITMGRVGGVLFESMLDARESSRVYSQQLINDIHSAIFVAKGSKCLSSNTETESASDKHCPILGYKGSSG